MAFRQAKGANLVWLLLVAVGAERFAELLPIIGRTEQGNPTVRVSVTFEGRHDAGVYALADVRGKGEDLVVVTLHLSQQRPLRYLGANWGLFRPYRRQLVRVAEEKTNLIPVSWLNFRM